MALPSTIKNFNTYVDGVSYVGQTEEVTLPTLSRKMEEYRGGGMDGPVDIDLGQEKLEAEVKFGGQVFDLLKHYGLCDPAGLRLRFSGAVQNDSSACGVDSLDIVMLGRISEISRDALKPGDMTPHTYKFPLTYYKETVNGVDLIEIDIPNYVFKVNGVDRLAEQRAAMGL